MGTEKRAKPTELNVDLTEKPFVIRRCNFNDLEQVKEVNERELPEDYPFFFYKSILDNFSESFLVACNKSDMSEIMGYIMWRIERTPSTDSLKLVNKGHLVSIAVLKEWRRTGIATALLKKSMPQVKKHNISEYVLEVRVSNYSAIKLYEKMDFEMQNIKKKYYRDGENAYFMVKTA
ncbi:MAG: GNAT family N-acetyltransferase [Candidatus Lokiarchaeota archaeon]|nr:GNAT family N-acetyltransferase [Candidatus Lokiarchaeota archaeon]